MRTIRQGDIVLVRVDGMPKSEELYQGLFWEEPEEKKFSARGETGNTHELSGIKEMMIPINPPPGINTVAVVKLDDGAKITHTGSGSTHPPVDVPPGTYEIHRGKEDENNRPVD